MSQLTLTRKRVAKNGIVSYKADSQRSTGTVYFDKKMFADGNAPETLVIDAEGIQVPTPRAPVAKSAAQPANEANA